MSYIYLSVKLNYSELIYSKALGDVEHMSASHSTEYSLTEIREMIY